MAGHSSTSAQSTPSSRIPVSLAKRLLFPHLPPGSDLPPLLATEDAELNAELYDFIALALRGFVNPWWTNITRYDKEFLREITRVIAIFLRSIEARLALADLPSFIFRNIPTIVSQHYSDYRNACAKVGTSYAVGGSSTLPQIFHQLQPHMAVSSSGQWNETYIRQAVEHIMKSCLSPPDWEAETERAIVREILSQVVLGGLFSRFAQPWFIQKLLLDLLDPFPPKPPDPPFQPAFHGRFTFHSVVVFFLSAVQTISGLCLAAIVFSQRALHTIHVINSSTSLTGDPHNDNLAHPVVDMIAEILTMRSRASSSSLLSLVELTVGFARPFANRALPYLLYHHVVNTNQLKRIIVQSRNSLFPNGYPVEPPPDPTPEEQIILRERLEARLLSHLPGRQHHVMHPQSPSPDHPLAVPASLLLGPDAASRRRTISNVIEPLTSPECNVHLLILLFDAVLLLVFPELGMVSGRLGNYTEDFDDPLVI